MTQSNVVVTGPNAAEGTYKNIVLKSNLGFEEQTREGYCIYHVKWNYDLGGAVVDIPANVVISMEGGVISNGTLVGHATQIIYDVPVDKAFVNVELEGTWIDDDDKQDARISELERISGNRAESTVLPTHMGRVTLKPNIAKRSNYWFVYPYTYTQYGHEKTDNILVYFNNNKYYLPRRYADTTPVALVAAAQDIVGEIPFSAGANIEDVATALDLQSGQYLSYDDRTKVITMPDSSTVNAYELVNDNWPLKNYTETDANILTQQMISKPNTIYVIQYDYELAEDITVPANCVLEFNGGSLSGIHTLTGNNTGINAGLVKIFNTDVILAGTWNIPEAYPEWFNSVNRAIDSFKVVKLFNKRYYCDESIHLALGQKIYGDNSSELVYTGNGNFIYTSNACIINSLKIKLSNENSTAIIFDATYIKNSISENKFNVNDAYASSRIYQIENVEFWYGVGQSENISNTAIKIIAGSEQEDTPNGFYGNIAKNCLIIGFWNYGIDIEVKNKGWLTSLVFKDIITSVCNVGVYIHGIGYNEPARNIIFDNFVYQSSQTLLDSNCYVGAFDNVWNLVFNCTIWDWYPTEYQQGPSYSWNRLPFAINPNGCRSISLIDAGINITTTTRVYKLTESQDVSVNDSFSVDVSNHNNKRFILADFFNPADSLKTLDLFSLSDGTYIALSSFITTFKLADVIVSDRFVLEKQSLTATEAIIKVYSTSAGTGVGAKKNCTAYMIIAKTINRGFQWYYWVPIQGGIRGENNAAGSIFYDSQNKLCYNNGSNNVDAFGASSVAQSYGTFANKPSGGIIYKGFRYFCTDRQTTEGATDGIEIIYKGKENNIDVWVDALGRVVS